MNTTKFLVLSLTLILSFNYAISQDDQTQSINEGSINEQFEYLLRKSGNFKGTNGQSYEAVRRSLINALQRNTIDSLKTLKADLNNTRATVETQQTEINNLQANLSNTQATLDATNKEKDSMSLFGMQMSKGGYNTLMWSIIAILTALFLLFVYKFKNSNAVTKEARKSLEETEYEFEEHRRTALEREQKVRRQLQDELNKQKENNADR